MLYIPLVILVNINYETKDKMYVMIFLLKNLR